ncbi:hypothetical protein FB451DRAFT_1295344 [Mycena latifolia]|nr:hypothetical protein FB451DRAFT_1295344 [Mycena latifolia]
MVRAVQTMGKLLRSIPATSEYSLSELSAATTTLRLRVAGTTEEAPSLRPPLIPRRTCRIPSRRPCACHAWRSASFFMSFAARSSCAAIALQSRRSLCSASCIAFARPSNAVRSVSSWRRRMSCSRCAAVTSPGRHAVSADRSANWWRSGVARARLCPRASELGVGVREPGLLVDEGTEGAKCSAGSWKACGDRIRGWRCRGSRVLRRKR